ncbi:hypothetical protein PLICRDRAFT_34105 [Plicaturopsis crispa FD-325 SS-3]|nr:hypothetical protein PLICRDRAFT_34105 [Plicaturopsis crispa FD-325 SS-3]
MSSNDTTPSPPNSTYPDYPQVDSQSCSLLGPTALASRAYLAAARPFDIDALSCES